MAIKWTIATKKKKKKKGEGYRVKERSEKNKLKILESFQEEENL